MSTIPEFTENFTRRVAAALAAVPAAEFAKAVEIFRDAYARDGRLFVFGNGGSWAMAGHWAADFNKTIFAGNLNTTIRRFQAMRVPSTAEELTAWGNDIGYEMTFAGPLANQLRPGDAIVALSSSGCSPNIVRAVQLAKSMKVPVVGVSGFNGGPLRELADAKLHVPTETGEYEVVESVHAALLHMLVRYFRVYPVSAGNERQNTSVFILGAGLGTRLRPATDTVPKVMVEIAPGMPLLEHTLRGMLNQGFRRFVINLHYHPEVIVRHFGDGLRFGARIEYSDETDNLMDTAGAIKKAAPLLSNTFVLMYGDQLHTYDFSPLLAQHAASSSILTLLLKRSDAPQNGDLVRLDREGRILEWIPRPHGHMELAAHMHLNAGVYVVNKRGLLPAIHDCPTSLDKQVIPEIFAARLPITAVVSPQNVLDVGTPEKLAFAREWYRKNNAAIKDWHGNYARPEETAISVPRRCD
jgi:phosphoheptose isomerase/choline kinase